MLPNNGRGAKRCPESFVFSADPSCLVKNPRNTSIRSHGGEADLLYIATENFMRGVIIDSSKHFIPDVELPIIDAKEFAVIGRPRDLTNTSGTLKCASGDVGHPSRVWVSGQDIPSPIKIKQSSTHSELRNARIEAARMRGTEIALRRRLDAEFRYTLALKQSTRNITVDAANLNYPTAVWVDSCGSGEGGDIDEDGNFGSFSGPQTNDSITIDEISRRSKHFKFIAANWPPHQPTAHETRREILNTRPSSRRVKPRPDFPRSAERIIKVESPNKRLYNHAIKQQSIGNINQNYDQFAHKGKDFIPTTKILKGDANVIKDPLKSIEALKEFQERNNSLLSLVNIHQELPKILDLKAETDVHNSKSSRPNPIQQKNEKMCLELPFVEAPHSLKNSDLTTTENKIQNRLEADMNIFDPNNSYDNLISYSNNQENSAMKHNFSNEFNEALLSNDEQIPGSSNRFHRIRPSPDRVMPLSAINNLNDSKNNSYNLTNSKSEVKMDKNEEKTANVEEMALNTVPKEELKTDVFLKPPQCSIEKSPSRNENKSEIPLLLPVTLTSPRCLPIDKLVSSFSFSTASIPHKINQNNSMLTKNQVNRDSIGKIETNSNSESSKNDAVTDKSATDVYQEVLYSKRQVASIVSLLSRLLGSYAHSVYKRDQILAYCGLPTVNLNFDEDEDICIDEEASNNHSLNNQVSEPTKKRNRNKISVHSVLSNQYASKQSNELSSTAKRQAKEIINNHVNCKNNSSNSLLLLKSLSSLGASESSLIRSYVHDVLSLGFGASYSNNGKSSSRTLRNNPGLSSTFFPHANSNSHAFTNNSFSQLHSNQPQVAIPVQNLISDANHHIDRFTGNANCFPSLSTCTLLCDAIDQLLTCCSVSLANFGVRHEKVLKLPIEETIYYLSSQDEISNLPSLSTRAGLPIFFQSVPVFPRQLRDLERIFLPCVLRAAFTPNRGSPPWCDEISQLLKGNLKTDNNKLFSSSISSNSELKSNGFELGVFFKTHQKAFRKLNLVAEEFIISLKNFQNAISTWINGVQGGSVNIPLWQSFKMNLASIFNLIFNAYTTFENMLFDIWHKFNKQQLESIRTSVSICAALSPHLIDSPNTIEEILGYNSNSINDGMANSFVDPLGEYGLHIDTTTSPVNPNSNNTNSNLNAFGSVPLSITSNTDAVASAENSGPKQYSTRFAVLDEKNTEFLSSAELEEKEKAMSINNNNDDHTDIGNKTEDLVNNGIASKNIGSLSVSSNNLITANAASNSFRTNILGEDESVQLIKKRFLAKKIATVLQHALQGSYCADLVLSLESLTEPCAGRLNNEMVSMSDDYKVYSNLIDDNFKKSNSCIPVGLVNSATIRIREFLVNSFLEFHESGLPPAHPLVAIVKEKEQLLTNLSNTFLHQNKRRMYPGLNPDTELRISSTPMNKLFPHSIEARIASKIIPGKKQIENLFKSANQSPNQLLKSLDTFRKNLRPNEQIRSRSTLYIWTLFTSLKAAYWTRINSRTALGVLYPHRNISNLSGGGVGGPQSISTHHPIFKMISTDHPMYIALEMAAPGLGWPRSKPLQGRSNALSRANNGNDNSLMQQISTENSNILDSMYGNLHGGSLTPSSMRGIASDQFSLSHINGNSKNNPLYSDTSLGLLNDDGESSVCPVRILDNTFDQSISALVYDRVERILSLQHVNSLDTLLSIKSAAHCCSEDWIELQRNLTDARLKESSVLRPDLLVSPLFKSLDSFASSSKTFSLTTSPQCVSLCLRLLPLLQHEVRPEIRHLALYVSPPPALIYRWLPMTLLMHDILFKPKDSRSFVEAILTTPAEGLAAYKRNHKRNETKDLSKNSEYELSFRTSIMNLDEIEEILARITADLSVFAVSRFEKLKLYMTDMLCVQCVSAAPVQHVHLLARILYNMQLEAARSIEELVLLCPHLHHLISKSNNENTNQTLSNMQQNSVINNNTNSARNKTPATSTHIVNSDGKQNQTNKFTFNSQRASTATIADNIDLDNGVPFSPQSQRMSITGISSVIRASQNFKKKLSSAHVDSDVSTPKRSSLHNVHSSFSPISVTNSVNRPKSPKSSTQYMSLHQKVPPELLATALRSSSDLASLFPGPNADADTIQMLTSLASWFVERSKASEAARVANGEKIESALTPLPTADAKGKSILPIFSASAFLTQSECQRFSIVLSSLHQVTNVIGGSVVLKSKEPKKNVIDLPINFDNGKSSNIASKSSQQQSFQDDTKDFFLNTGTVDENLRELWCFALDLVREESVLRSSLLTFLPPGTAYGMPLANPTSRFVCFSEIDFFDKRKSLKKKVTSKHNSIPQSIGNDLTPLSPGTSNDLSQRQKHSQQPPDVHAIFRLSEEAIMRNIIDDLFDPNVSFDSSLSAEQRLLISALDTGVAQPSSIDPLLDEESARISTWLARCKQILGYSRWEKILRIRQPMAIHHAKSPLADMFIQGSIKALENLLGRTGAIESTDYEGKNFGKGHPGFDSTLALEIVSTITSGFSSENIPLEAVKLCIRGILSSEGPFSFLKAHKDIVEAAWGAGDPYLKLRNLSMTAADRELAKTSIVPATSGTRNNSGAADLSSIQNLQNNILMRTNSNNKRQVTLDFKTSSPEPISTIGNQIISDMSPSAQFPASSMGVLSPDASSLRHNSRRQIIPHQSLSFSPSMLANNYLGVYANNNGSPAILKGKVVLPDFYDLNSLTDSLKKAVQESDRKMTFTRLLPSRGVSLLNPAPAFLHQVHSGSNDISHFPQHEEGILTNSSLQNSSSLSSSEGRQKNLSPRLCINSSGSKPPTLTSLPPLEIPLASNSEDEFHLNEENIRPNSHSESFMVGTLIKSARNEIGLHSSGNRSAKSANDTNLSTLSRRKLKDIIEARSAIARSGFQEPISNNGLKRRRVEDFGAKPEVLALRNAAIQQLSEEIAAHTVNLIFEQCGLGDNRIQDNRATNSFNRKTIRDRVSLGAAEVLNTSSVNNNRRVAFKNTQYQSQANTLGASNSPLGGSGDGDGTIMSPLVTAAPPVSSVYREKQSALRLDSIPPYYQAMLVNPFESLISFLARIKMRIDKLDTQIYQRVNLKQMLSDDNKNNYYDGFDYSETSSPGMSSIISGDHYHNNNNVAFSEDKDTSATPDNHTEGLITFRGPFTTNNSHDFGIDNDLVGRSVNGRSIVHFKNSSIPSVSSSERSHHKQRSTELLFNQNPEVSNLPIHSSTAFTRRSSILPANSDTSFSTVELKSKRKLVEDNVFSLTGID